MGIMWVSHKPGKVELLHLSGERTVVEMREYGHAVMTARRDDNDVFDMVQRRAEAWLRELEANVKTLYVSEPPKAEVSPTVDVLRRFNMVGWRAVVGAPEIEFFRKWFECHEPHYDNSFKGVVAHVRAWLRRKVYG